MKKIPNHLCAKCGMEVEVPDYDEMEPLHRYFRKWNRAVLKHGWQYHREDFPPQFRTFSEFMRWITTPEGKGWNQKQGLAIEAQRIIREARRGPE